MPNVVILAGPNGAGKTSAAPTLLRDELRVAEFVNADVIARGLSGFSADGVAKVGFGPRVRLRYSNYEPAPRSGRSVDSEKIRTYSSYRNRRLRA